MISKINYQVAMPQPNSHLFEVTLQIKNWSKPILDLKMPVWTPGSYLIREYAKQVQDFRAQTSLDNQSLSSYKISKNHWQVETQEFSDITIYYRVFANELTVRTNHLNHTHGYFNGGALFYFIPGLEKEPITVKILPPKPEWQVTTILPVDSEAINTFLAPDFDTLVDSPFEIGIHRLNDFEVLGKPHQLAIWGEGNAKAEQIIADTSKIIETEAKLYGELPYEKYLFLVHLSDSGFGGLEHKNCCSLNYSRFGFRSRDKYNRFMQLVAHEFFHLWNVKRIRPQALEKYNYEEENYTSSLWFCEGTTSYYDMLIPLRAGIYDVKTFWQILSKDITRFLTAPGRKVQPLSESSFDAWIKLYRPDANSNNNQISYYLKGAMISLLLDLLIRERHHNRYSLDDVMVQMWSRFGKPEIGFTPKQLQEVIESVAGIDLNNFFSRYLDGLEELPFERYFEPFGLRLQGIMEKEPFPHLGITVQTKHGKEIIKFVESNSPAAIAGIDAGDELLAIDGIRVSGQQLNRRLQDYRANDIIQITVFNHDQLRTIPVTLAEPKPSRYAVIPIENPSKLQKQNLAGWLQN